MAKINKPSKVARRWSFQLTGLGAAILTWLANDPWTLMTIWGYLPDVIKDRLHPQAVLMIPVFIFILAMVAMFLPQKGLTDDKDP